MPLKRRIRCRYATAPSQGCAYTFQWTFVMHDSVPLILCGGRAGEAISIQPNERRRPARPSFSDVSPVRAVQVSMQVSTVVRSGVEPLPATYQIAMLPLQHRTMFVQVSGSYGNRTHLPALKGRYPLTDRRTSPVRAACAQRAGRRSNPRLLVFSQALDRLSYRPVSILSSVLRMFSSS